MQPLFNPASKQNCLRFADVMQRVHRLHMPARDAFRVAFSSTFLGGATEFNIPITARNPQLAATVGPTGIIVFIGGYDDAQGRLAMALAGGAYADPIGWKFPGANVGLVEHYNALNLDSFVNVLAPTTDVLLVGYSGGGALAAMLGYAMALRFAQLPLSIVTFGAPRALPRRWFRNQISLQWARIDNFLDIVQYVVPHASEVDSLTPLPPSLQNNADKFTSGGYPINISPNGSFSVRTRDVQDDHVGPVSNDVLSWMLGRNNLSGQNKHLIELYVQSMRAVSEDPAHGLVPFWGESASQAPTGPPATPVPEVQSVPSGFAGSARAANNALVQAINVPAGPQPDPTENTPVRRPYVAVRARDGWYVNYLTMPLFRANGRKQARARASELNRLVRDFRRSSVRNTVELATSITAEAGD